MVFTYTSTEKKTIVVSFSEIFFYRKGMQKKAQDVLFLLTGGKIKHTNEHPECPYYTSKDVLQERHYSDYSPEAQRVISLITIEQGLEPVGSSKYQAHKYPSDIDLFEPVQGCCGINAVRLPMVRALQNIIRRLENEPSIHFARFQCGYDRRYDIYWGKESKGQVLDWSARIARREINNLYYQELITEQEQEAALSLVKENPSVRDFLRLYWFFRNFMALDWNTEEIKRGYKDLRGGKRMYLDDALIDKSLVKLDVWAKLPYPDMKGARYVEVTNWFLVQVEDENGEIQTLSIVQEDRLKSLRADIYKYYAKDALKTSKRYWNYLFELEQTPAVLRELRKLAPLFSSYIAFLNSVATDLELQERMLRVGLLEENAYKAFLLDTKRRLLAFAPACYLEESLNEQLAQTLDEKKMLKAVDNLTRKYWATQRVDILDFVEKH